MASKISSPCWKAAIARAISEHKKSVVFQLATTDNESGLARVRSLVFRGFLTEDPNVPPLLLTTTDIRTPKARQLATSPDIELAWWVEGTQEQFRITGSAFVVAAPGRGHQLATPVVGGHAKKSTSAVLGLLEKAGSFNWEAKRQEVFNDMSPRMRASWCVPATPGSRLMGGYEECKGWRETLPRLGEECGDDEEKKDLEVAFGNFALVVIEPGFVDYLELGVMPHRRTTFRLMGDEWVEESVVP